MIGYFCYNQAYQEHIKEKLQPGVTYSYVEGIKVYTIYGNLEESLRNSDGNNIYMVEGIGDIRHIPDTNDSLLERYEVPEIKIIKHVPREEIIKYGATLKGNAFINFMKLFKFQKDDITSDLVAKYKEGLDEESKEMLAIKYYLEGNKNVYKEDFEKYNEAVNRLKR